MINNLIRAVSYKIEMWYELYLHIIYLSIMES